jgi:7-cyano-7-deazaguanine reductase
MRHYTVKHAKSGIDEPLPAIECWENQYPDYEIEIVIPEYTAICPKTGLPDFGTIYVNYVPDKMCLELKSLKEYITAYRNLGIFYENAVNRILRDLVAACQPVTMKVRGEFTPRGGIQSRVEARYSRPIN